MALHVDLDFIDGAGLVRLLLDRDLGPKGTRYSMHKPALLGLELALFVLLVCFILWVCDMAPEGPSYLGHSKMCVRLVGLHDCQNS